MTKPKPNLFKNAKFYFEGLRHPELPDQDRCTQIDASTWTVPLTTVPLRYFDVYNTLFFFENTLRMFVYAALKARYGRDWLQRPIGSGRAGADNVAGADVTKGTIDSIAKKRISSLRTHSYVGELVELPMLYLDFDELVGLIQDHKQVFQPILRGAAETFGHKLQEARVIRNNLAHFRKVTEDDYERLTRVLADVFPIIKGFLREITIDIEEFYQEDAPRLGGLQARSKQLLDGVKNLDIEIRMSRTLDWVDVTLRQSFKQTTQKPCYGIQWLWVLDPSFLWYALAKAGVFGSVVCYMSNGDYKKKGPRGIISGHVRVRYVLPWKPVGNAPAPEVVSFVEELAGLARRLDQDYRHAGVVTPQTLARLETRVLDNVRLNPHVSPLCPRVPCIIEDWTGAWDVGMPWIDEQTDRSNEAAAELMAKEGILKFLERSR